MRHRILVPARALPAQLLGGITGTFQRAQMIANQATQIANQMRTMTRQLTELEEQLDYMKDVARGEVHLAAERCLLAAGLGRTHERVRKGSRQSYKRAGPLRPFGRGTALQACLRTPDRGPQREQAWRPHAHSLLCLCGARTLAGERKASG